MPISEEGVSKGDLNPPSVQVLISLPKVVMSGIAADLMKPVVVDLIAEEEEDELMRTAELNSAADIHGVDIGDEAPTALLEKEEEPGTSGATIPDPLTQVKEEADGQDTIPAHFTTPVTPPPKLRHFELGTPPEKKPKFPGKAGLAHFGGGQLIPPLYAGPVPMEPASGVPHYHIGERSGDNVYRASDKLSSSTAPAAAAKTTVPAAAAAATGEPTAPPSVPAPVNLPRLPPLGPLPKLPTTPTSTEAHSAKVSGTHGPNVAQDLIQSSAPPPWLAQVLDSLHGMHSKQDALSTDVSAVQRHFQQELNTHRQAIQGLQSAHEANASLHETTARKILALEEQVQELRAAARTPPRTPPRSPRNLGPRREGSRSPGPRQPQTLQDLRDELQIIVGGWLDARRDEIEREVQSWLQEIGKQQHVHEIVVPYIRCSHAKILLDLTQDASIVSGRALQKNVIDSLKAANLATNIPGQQENRIWVTPHRTIEERNRIKAVVSVKEFMSAEALRRGIACDVDLVWRGKVFMGKHQVLGSMLRGDPGDTDILLEDARGDHTGWYLIGAKVAEAFRISVDEVRQLWEEHLDASSRAAR